MERMARYKAKTPLNNLLYNFFSQQLFFPNHTFLADGFLTTFLAFGVSFFTGFFFLLGSAASFISISFTSQHSRALLIKSDTWYLWPLVHLLDIQERFEGTMKLFCGLEQTSLTSLHAFLLCWGKRLLQDKSFSWLKFWADGSVQINVFFTQPNAIQAFQGFSYTSFFCRSCG